MNSMEKMRDVGRFFELYEVTAYEGYRHRKDDTVQSVTVKVFDAGPTVSPDLRYRIVAEADGKLASGNPSHSVDDALVHVHWWDLD